MRFREGRVAVTNSSAIQRVREAPMIIIWRMTDGSLIARALSDRARDGRGSWSDHLLGVIGILLITAKTDFRPHSTSAYEWREEAGANLVMRACNKTFITATSTKGYKNGAKNV